MLICGYDAEADMFEIRDPASSKYPLFPLSTSGFMTFYFIRSLPLSLDHKHDVWIQKFLEHIMFI